MRIMHHLGNASLRTNLLTWLFWHRQFYQRNKPDRSKRVPTALDFYERVNFRRLLFFSASVFLLFTSFPRNENPSRPGVPFLHIILPFSFFSHSLNPSFSQENDILKCHPLSISLSLSRGTQYLLGR